uniref:Uncharacterized protein n=1 Tax=Lactuca sativa TaxID=4236 RepID=A0A9R1XDS4_LACSA|nr:hypothetical protein LSAT_V11C400201320 [Lactuca sativa]
MSMIVPALYLEIQTIFPYQGCYLRKIQGCVFCEIQGDVQWCMLFADNIVLVTDTRIGLNAKSKKVLGSTHIRRIIYDDILAGSRITQGLKDKGVDDNVTHHIKVGWVKWRSVQVFCVTRRSY